ncbi:MAG: hypothetical protein OXI96_10345, partial [Acidimicrobiaceae bacterium]|nr:hypothetical protein [Acidimicrobiaceae bacterium]
LITFSFKIYKKTTLPSCCVLGGGRRAPPPPPPLKLNQLTFLMKARLTAELVIVSRAARTVYGIPQHSQQPTDHVI